MPAKKNLIWLASYPKSGNTWLRILLSNYNKEDDNAIDINEIDSSIISSSRSIFDSYSPFLASDLTDDEVDNLRASVYNQISKDNEEIVFIKTHDAFTQNTNGENIFPTSATKGVIHIVRNPLDVASSYAHHSNISIDKSVKTLNTQQTLSANPKLLNAQLRQKLLSWSDHYLSWKNAKVPYLLIKYEDLLADTEEEFRRVIIFLYKKADDKKLKMAVEQSSFRKLKQQEEAGNFKERAINSKSFFRKGKTGSWKEEMSENQIKEIVKNNQIVMKELSYIDN